MARDERQADFRDSVGDDPFESAEEWALSHVPRGLAAARLDDQALLNRAIDVYLDQAATASVFALRGFADEYRFFVDLARRVQREPVDAFAPFLRFKMASLGIEKGVRFAPEPWMQTLLAEAARLGAAIARAARLVYDDRRWEWAFVGGTPGLEAPHDTDSAAARATLGDMALEVAPQMIELLAHGGSQFLWTSRDAEGAPLDGGKHYRLRLPAEIPARSFWSLVAYDALGCKTLPGGDKFPTVSCYSGPKPNRDGSIDIVFGPRAPRRDDQANWIKTVEGQEWFALLRFNGATRPFFDASWRPGDIAAV